MMCSKSNQIRHFVRRAVNSAQSPIGRNIAIIRHRYIICIFDIIVNHVLYIDNVLSFSQRFQICCIFELLCLSNNENDIPGFVKTDVNTMINALGTC